MMETVKSKNSRTNSLTILLRLILGSLFLVAGLQKIGEPAAFARSIANYRLISGELVTWSAVLVPWLEILIGSSLLLGWLTRISAMTATALSLGFALFTGSALVRGLNVDCGCFTGASEVSVAHWLVNVLMIAAGTWLGLKGAPRLSVDSYLNNPDRLSLKSRLTLVALLLMALLPVVGAR